MLPLDLKFYDFQLSLFEFSLALAAFYKTGFSTFFCNNQFKVAGVHLSQNWIRESLPLIIDTYIKKRFNNEEIDLLDNCKMYVSPTLPSFQVQYRIRISLIFCSHEIHKILNKISPEIHNVIICLVSVCVWAKVYPEIRDTTINFVCICVWLKIYSEICNVIMGKNISWDVQHSHLLFFLNLCLRTNISWDAHCNHLFCLHLNVLLRNS